ncbi:MAG TPA: hypothetical protein C5S37_01680 [Methanophagales archaeon]|nr:hypothetical protein [Methanophagales archaeon]
MNSGAVEAEVAKTTDYTTLFLFGKKKTCAKRKKWRWRRKRWKKKLVPNETGTKKEVKGKKKPVLKEETKQSFFSKGFFRRKKSFRR